MKKSIVAIFLVAILILGFAFLFAYRERWDTSPEKRMAIRNSLLKEFAAFDRAYIPALSLTNQEKIEPSRKAMANLKQNWETLSNKYYSGAENNLGFQRSLNKVQNAINKADGMANSGENLKEAHEALEEIRFILMDIRRRNLYFQIQKPPAKGIKYQVARHEYFVDYLNEFHEIMETIVLTAKGKTSETIADEDIEKIKENLAEAAELFDIIKGVEFEQPIFDFSDEKTQIMWGYVDQEAESLGKLSKALEGGSKEDIIKASAEIKPAFVKLFLLFGDFESLQ